MKILSLVTAAVFALAGPAAFATETTAKPAAAAAKPAEPAAKDTKAAKAPAKAASAPAPAKKKEKKGGC